MRNRKIISILRIGFILDQLHKARYKNRTNVHSPLYILFFLRNPRRPRLLVTENCLCGGGAGQHVFILLEYFHQAAVI